MQKCLKCSNQFTWKDITKSKWFSRGAGTLECNNCRTKYKINPISKLLYNFLIMVIPVVLIFVKRDYIVNVFGYYYLLLYLLWIGLMACIAPFYARFDIEIKE